MNGEVPKDNLPCHNYELPPSEVEGIKLAIKEAHAQGKLRSKAWFSHRLHSPRGVYEPACPMAHAGMVEADDCGEVMFDEIPLPLRDAILCYASRFDERASNAYLAYRHGEVLEIALELVDEVFGPQDQ